MQTLAESLIKLHGGDKDLLLVGTHEKFPIVPGNGTMEEVLEKIIKNKQNEIESLKAALLLMGVSKLLPGGTELEED